MGRRRKQNITLTAYCARPKSDEEQIAIQDAGEREALKSGNLEEAKRMRQRGTVARMRKSQHQKNSISGKRSVRRVQRNRDPLSNFPDHLRIAGELLRDHSEGLIITIGGGGSGIGEFVDSSRVDSGLEGFVQARRKGRKLWTHATQAVSDQSLVEVVYMVIANQLSFSRAADKRFGNEGGQARANVKQGVYEALSAAASYLGFADEGE
jgi:hypothetical protein